MSKEFSGKIDHRRGVDKRLVEEGQILSTAQPTDYAKLIGDADVIAIGERHPRNEGLIEELSHAMPVLRELGVSHFGMEQLDITSQPAIDVYQDDQNNETAIVLREHLKQFRWNTDGYLDLIEAATEENIKVVGIDSALQISFDQTRRDAHFARVVKDIFPSRGKVATLSGSAHASNSCAIVSKSTMTQNLRTDGLKVVSVGTIELPGIKGYATLVEPLEAVIAGSPLCGEAVMFEGKEYADTGVPFDWVVNMKPPSEGTIDQFLRHRDRRS